MDFSLKKTFKSHGSSKHMRKISAGAVEDTSHEELPILNDHHTRAATASDLPDHRKEVIVKIDEGISSVVTDSAREVDPTKHHSGRIWRENSIDFWTEDERSNTAAGSGGFQFAQKGRQMATPEEDPPTKLVGQFFNKQRGGGGDVSLDMDLEMDELQKPPVAESPRISEMSRVLKVSFQSPAPSDLPDMPNDSVRRRNRDSVIEDERRHSNRLSSGGADVLKCTSNK